MKVESIKLKLTVLHGYPCVFLFTFSIETVENIESESESDIWSPVSLFVPCPLIVSVIGETITRIQSQVRIIAALQGFEVERAEQSIFFRELQRLCFLPSYHETILLWTVHHQKQYRYHSRIEVVLHFPSPSSD